MLKAFGVSTKTVEGGLLAVDKTDVVMVTYNPLAREEEPVIDKAKEFNKGVLIKKGLLSGHLNTLEDSAKSPVEQSLQFIFSKPGVSSVIVRTINCQHLEQNVELAKKALARN